MPISVLKQGLFAGALCAAGVMSRVADADVGDGFIPAPASGGNPNSIFGAVWDKPESLIFHEEINASGDSFPDSITYRSDSGSLVASITPLAFEIEMHVAESSEWHLAGVGIYQHFTVNAPTFVQLEWELPFGGFARLRPVGEADILFVPLSGTSPLTATLTPGVLYRYEARFFATDTSEGDAWIHLFVVPAPSAMTLLGLGMLGVKRRRRE